MLIVSSKLLLNLFRYFDRGLLATCGWAAAAALTEFSDIGFGFGCCQRNCHEKDDGKKENKEDNGDGLVIVITAIDGNYYGIL